MITALLLILGWVLVRQHVKRLWGMADDLRTAINK